MSRFGRADEVVEVGVEDRPERTPARREFVDVVLRRFAGRGRGIGDFLTVFVDAGQCVGGAEGARGAHQHVGGDRRVGVADVRIAADVVDRRGDEKGAVHHRSRSRFGRAWTCAAPLAHAGVEMAAFAQALLGKHFRNRGRAQTLLDERANGGVNGFGE